MHPVLKIQWSLRCKAWVRTACIGWKYALSIVTRSQNSWENAPGKVVSCWIHWEYQLVFRRMAPESCCQLPLLACVATTCQHRWVKIMWQVAGAANATRQGDDRRDFDWKLDLISLFKLQMRLENPKITLVLMVLEGK